jgi:alanine racemase
MPPAHKTWVEVSRSALRANAATLKRLAGRGVSLVAVVKSNAYGHGITQVVRALGSSADWYGVDSINEAVTVRAAGAKQPVLILGYTLDGRLKEAVDRGFRLTVYNDATIRRLAKVATAKRPALVHVKIETGTSRQGVLTDDLLPFVARARRNKHVIIEGVSTHFANIEDTTDRSYATGQLSRFRKALKALEGAGVRPAVVHTACSAAVMLYPDTHFSAVRAGIALYGLWPSPTTKVSLARMGKEGRGETELQPALAWKTVVAQVKRLDAGSPVSYGLTERLTRDSTVAVLPIGYWDGFDRKLSSVGNVLIRGKLAKVLGRVCMNICVVDVTDSPGVKPEDEVVLIGRQKDQVITADELAQKIGTINYETVTRINPTSPRILV